MTLNNTCHHIGCRTLYLRLLLAIGCIILLGLAAHWFEFYIPRIENWIKSLGALGPAFFILLFTVATPFFLSVDALCVAAGVLFPLSTGSFYIIISTYLAATVMFVLGRYFFQDKVKELLTKHKTLENIDTLLVDNDFKIMFLLRLLPLPFALLSYTFSVSQVKFKPYIMSSSGILIYNIALVYFGYTAKHIASIASATASASSVNYPLLGFGAISILFILAMIVRTVRKMIDKIASNPIETEHNQ